MNLTMQLTAYFLRLHPDATVPVYKTAQAAACDLWTIRTECIEPGELAKVPLGLVAIPPIDYHWEIYLRSSTPIKYPGLLLANHVGIIDTDYCGPEDELKLLLYNSGKAPAVIGMQERVAQMRLVPNTRPVITELTREDYDRLGLRSRRGLGSTG